MIHSAVPWQYTLAARSALPASAQAPVARPFDPAGASLQDVVQKLDVDPSQGLSAPEAARRLQEVGPNRIATEKGSSALQRLAAQFTNPLSLLLLPAGVIAAATGEIPDAIGIGVVSLLNAAIGFAQETKAEKSMESLSSLTVRDARVLRDGQRRMIPASGLVPGDVISLNQGEVVPADARLLTSTSLSTDEAALTGEALPVAKDAAAVVAPNAPLHARDNMVFSGSGVKSGAGEAVVTATGLSSEIGYIAHKTQTAAPPDTPLDRDLKKVSRQFMGIGGVCSVLIGGATAAATGSPLAGLATAISTMVAVVPEGLPTVTTLTLTNGIREARERNVLIRKLSSVETLGSTTVIATDKTGTLTTGEMEGRKLWTATPATERIAVLGALLGSTAEKEGDQWRGSPTEVALSRYIEHLPGTSIAKTAPDCVTVRFNDRVTQEFHVAADEMADLAPLLEAGKTGEAIVKITDAVRSRTKDYPFSSDRKLHTVAVPGALLGESGYVSFTSGALDRILPLTSLTDAEKDAMRAENDRLACQGFRVVALAHKMTAALGGVDEAESGLTLSGLMAIQDPLRAGVRDSVAELRGAGIRVMVITGDQILTARAIAEEAGILEDSRPDFTLSEELLDGVDAATPQGRATLEAFVKQAEAAEEVVISGKWIDLFEDKKPGADGRAIFSYDRFKSLVKKAKVAYRVEPRHKFRLVQCLQDLGETVAMTGDGVNDAPAIKAADIGIAMGQRGTEVTREAAAMILTDDSFNSIAHGVEVGRLIHTNIRKSMMYTVSSNLGEILSVGLTSAAGLALGGSLGPMLTPLQLLWINLATDSLPAISLGQEPAERELMQEQPRARDAGLLGKDKIAQVALVGGTMGAVAAGLSLLHPLAGVAANVAQTMAFNFLVTSQCVNALNARKEGNESPLKGLLQNKMLLASVVGTVAAQVALPFITGVGAALKVASLTLPQWALVGGLSAAMLPVGYAAKRLFHKHEG